MMITMLLEYNKISLASSILCGEENLLWLHGLTNTCLWIKRDVLDSQLPSQMIQFIE